MDNLDNNKSLKGYKVISAVLMALAIIIYSFTLALDIYCLIDAFMQEGWAWVGFVLILALSTIAYAVVLLLSLIGLITTIVKRKQGAGKGKLIVFIIFSLLPIITEIAFIVVCNMV